MARQTTLRDAIDGTVMLTEAQVWAIVRMFCTRCTLHRRIEAANRLRHPTELPGLAIFEQVILQDDGIDFAVAQDWKDERRRIQQLLVGGGK
jgi:hypothetical protein